MNKVYYLDLTHSKKDGTGIKYKIYKQIEVMRFSGLSVQELCVEKKTNWLINLVSKLPLINLRLDYTVLNEVTDDSIIYIRYFLMDIWLYLRLKNIKKRSKNVKVLIEIPTYPYDLEYKKWHPYILKDRVWRDKLKKVVDKIITYSNDKEIYGIGAINISNAVDTKKISMNQCIQHSGINIVAVAKLAFWHGFDRVIEGIHEYYNNSGKTEDVKFYIVGYGDSLIISEYQSMIKRWNLEEKVFLLGEKSGDELDAVYNFCDIAVDSMGRHRSNVFYNSSLKGKEYMAKGLPIISGVTTELDFDENYPFYMRVPSDDSQLNIDDVIKYYHSIYDKLSHYEVKKRVRVYCEKHFDFEVCFNPVIRELLK